MGNENKVDNGDLIVTKTREFFKDGLIDSSTAGKMYSLADEYARTRQAKQFLLYFSVFLFIGSLVLTTMLLTMRIRQKKSVEINIAELKSVNLTELLTTSRKNEGRMRGLEAEIRDIRQQQSSAVTTVRDRTRAQISLLGTMNLGTEERKRREKRLLREEAARIAAINRDANQKLAPRIEERDRIRKQMSMSKKRIARTQTAIDNFQQLWDIEEKKLRRDYEARIRMLQQDHRKRMASYERFHKKFVASLIMKYNPIFESGTLKGILDGREGRSGVAPSPWSSLLGEERIINRDEYSDLLSRVRDDFKLIRRLKQIQYTNSVAPALGRIESLTALVVYTYDTLWNNLVRKVGEKNTLIGKHRNALAAYAARNREHGYVVNADDPASLILVMNRDYPVSSGTEAIVIRGERRKVAMIRFVKGGDGIRAKVLSVVSNARIQPLDKVLIKIQ